MDVEIDHLRAHRIFDMDAKAGYLPSTGCVRSIGAIETPEVRRPIHQSLIPTLFRDYFPGLAKQDRGRVSEEFASMMRYARIIDLTLPLIPGEGSRRLPTPSGRFRVNRMSFPARALVIRGRG
jgi:hypothetical protein